ncbi:helix-turn-helix domain-containing protein [Streptomyces sp. NPDC050504]|uniref:helix-turn-helix domain-containing protein n=1 Tax=Streptomyces sp. NPDC050504 TaxID=3365618 RepID=UPI0037A1F463
MWTKAGAGGTPVLPDGCMDVIWAEGRLFVAGPDTRAHAAPRSAERFVGIRFAPGTAPALLGVPAHELRDLRVDLDELWPAAQAHALAGRVGTAADPVAALEALMLRRAADAPRPDPVLRAVAAALAGGGAVGEVADAVGLGARQLHRRSLVAFGYGPKTLARILRLQRALELVRAGVPYAGAAVAAGCTDQPHLAREMRALTGLTLTAYASGASSGASGAVSAGASAGGLAANSETPIPSGSSTTA